MNVKSYKKKRHLLPNFIDDRSWTQQICVFYDSRLFIWEAKTRCMMRFLQHFPKRNTQVHTLTKRLKNDPNRD